jgi:hypothetical protein
MPKRMFQRILKPKWGPAAPAPGGPPGGAGVNNRRKKKGGGGKTMEE